ncbi:hypothetical protein TCAL_10165 [Tigriopus californicus]|uniref:BHLH domain-containing protein n=1 Tax=Tigriopus californicus TaxID=6832 RepID=A0A553P7L3_TIGCA|nr:achaete-scute complex protein T5-like [Tigriopus californicus]TRY73676.1 hypothetical protein TCAL_10165 [Tigriopus californicus]|eukprot:TCALIF_10165-PA protein Name:"Similar to ascl1b Achaete-scute homolog 1b (Danio rerio)" AED:0.01 eAED:0.07 QI:0/-1/0/1/-1/1/1/0/269
MHNKPIVPKIEPSIPTTDFMKRSSPDSVSSSTNGTFGPASRCRRKIAFHPIHGYAIPPPQPAKVARRNARERNRVKQVNSGFEMLRVHIPTIASQKKASKVETLRHAVEYIQRLQTMLGDQQHHHHVQQQQPQHPGTPSTPITPSTPSGNPMISASPNEHFVYPSSHTPATPHTPVEANVTPYSFNESGYETSSTSSYYSGGSLISPSPNMGPHSHQHYFSNLTPNISGNNFNQELCSFIPSQNTDLFEHNSDEDELLDVIAKWQEGED